MGDDGLIKWIIIAIIAVPFFILIGLIQNPFQQTAAGETSDFTHYIQKNGVSGVGLYFGSSQFSVSDPQYSSDCDQQTKEHAPNPMKECWSANAVFQGTEYNLPIDEWVEVNEWLSVKWNTDALVDNGELEDFDRTDTLEVKFDPDKAMEFSLSMPEKVEFGSEGLLTIEINNRMDTTVNTIIEAEVISRLFAVVDTFAGESTFLQQNSPISSGISEVEISIPYEKLGSHKNKISLIPVLLYSEGEYLEGTTRHEIETEVVTSAVFSGEFDTKEPKERAFPLSMKTVSQMSVLEKLATSTIILWFVGVVAVVIIVWNGIVLLKN